MRTLIRVLFVFISFTLLSCCLDFSNNFKEINPSSLKYTSKKLVIKLHCGNLYELFVDEGAFGAHEDYILEAANGKVFYLSNAYLQNTYQRFIFNPVDSTIVYFDEDEDIWPNLEAECFWIKIYDEGHMKPIDTLRVDSLKYVEKIFRLNNRNELEPYADLEGNEFEWPENGIYYVGYPGVFYHKKLKLCDLK